VTDDKRREKRFPARIVARLQRRGEPVEVLTDDVSFRGVFVRTDAPPAQRQLLRVGFVLPSGARVAAHAMVVFVVPPGDPERVPGAGLQFWGPIENAKEWDAFVREAAADHRKGTAKARAADKVRRSSERFKLTLEVVLDGVTTQTRDVSENSMAIRSDTAVPVGTRVRVIVRADGDALELDVVIRRIIDEPGFRGLGVEYMDMSSDARRAIVAFVRGHEPPEEKVFIDVGDPHLH
jgi:hypothetical protein